MIKQMLFVAIVSLTGTLNANAQGIIGGAQQGSEEGSRAAGPVGGFVGGVLGSVAGGINGLLGGDQQPRFREYVVREQRPSHHYDGELAVGVELPDRDVIYYEVPTEYGAKDYRYTVINGRTVLVDPRTRRVVQVID